MIRQILKKKFTSTFHSRFYNKEIGKNITTLPPLSENKNDVLTSIPSLNKETNNTTNHHLDSLEPIYQDTENVSIFTNVFNYISPTQLFEFVLTQLHDVTGIPWYLTISLTALTFKTLLLPVVIKTAKNAAKLQQMQPGKHTHLLKDFKS
jgi:membrane protein insertase Oxa1/YidC/SpoIIIJ